MTRLFFLFSGEHEQLPLSELKAILEAEGYRYEILEKLDQVARVETDYACLEALTRRAALTRICGLELFNCEADVCSILKAIRFIDLAEALGEQHTFVVRVKHVKEYSSKINGMILERKIGEVILNQYPKAKVNVRNPTETFVGILTGDRFVFGLSLARIQPKPFVERRPRRKPFFHPSAMQAKLARCMINLAEPRTGELVLDPFCGTGSFLIEASLIGCRVVGLDIQRRMARGTLKNLLHFNIDADGVIVADARSMPISRFDCVVTDPPYGISSTTVKRTTKQIVEDLFIVIHGLLERKRRICIAAPKTLHVGQLGSDLGYMHLESHLVYVHRSLTREIAVFEKG